jgi:hypothetical protein
MDLMELLVQEMDEEEEVEANNLDDDLMDFWEGHDMDVAMNNTFYRICSQMWCSTHSTCELPICQRSSAWTISDLERKTCQSCLIFCRNLLGLCLSLWQGRLITYK